MKKDYILYLFDILLWYNAENIECIWSLISCPEKLDRFELKLEIAQCKSLGEGDPSLFTWNVIYMYYSQMVYDKETAKYIDIFKNFFQVLIWINREVFN